MVGRFGLGTASRRGPLAFFFTTEGGFPGVIFGPKVTPGRPRAGARGSPRREAARFPPRRQRGEAPAALVREHAGEDLPRGALRPEPRDELLRRWAGEPGWSGSPSFDARRDGVFPRSWIAALRLEDAGIRQSLRSAISSASCTAPSTSHVHAEYFLSRRSDPEEEVPYAAHPQHGLASASSTATCPCIRGGPLKGNHPRRQVTTVKANIFTCFPGQASGGWGAGS
jgi:hypothetical protein